MSDKILNIVKPNSTSNLENEDENLLAVDLDADKRLTKIESDAKAFIKRLENVERLTLSQRKTSEGTQGFENLN